MRLLTPSQGQAESEADVTTQPIDEGIRLTREANDDVMRTLARWAVTILLSTHDNRCR
jgi:hypothetical protein